MKSPSPHKRRQRSLGFTLLEALLLVSILGIVGVGIGSGMNAMTKSPSQNNNALAIETAMLDKMEYLRAQPYSTLAADVPNFSSGFSDYTSVNGTNMRRTVTIVYADPATSATSVTPTHMLKISVAIDDKVFVSLVNEP